MKSLFPVMAVALTFVACGDSSDGDSAERKDKNPTNTNPNNNNNNNTGDDMAERCEDFCEWFDSCFQMIDCSAEFTGTVEQCVAQCEADEMMNDENWDSYTDGAFGTCEQQAVGLCNDPEYGAATQASCSCPADTCDGPNTCYPIEGSMGFCLDMASETGLPADAPACVDGACAEGSYCLDDGSETGACIAGCELAF